MGVQYFECDTCGDCVDSNDIRTILICDETYWTCDYCLQYYFKKDKPSDDFIYDHVGETGYIFYAAIEGTTEIIAKANNPWSLEDALEELRKDNIDKVYVFGWVEKEDDLNNVNVDFLKPEDRESCHRSALEHYDVNVYRKKYRCSIFDDCEYSYTPAEEWKQKMIKSLDYKITLLKRKRQKLL